MDSMYYAHGFIPCLNEIEIGGHSECRAPMRQIDMCPEYCKYYIPDVEEFLHMRSEDKKYMKEYHYKPKWNESRHRCYEGIPIDKKIPKTHDDEWEHKQFWKEEYINFMIKWFGPIHCIELGII